MENRNRSERASARANENAHSTQCGAPLLLIGGPPPFVRVNGLASRLAKTASKRVLNSRGIAAGVKVGAGTGVVGAGC